MMFGNVNHMPLVICYIAMIFSMALIEKDGLPINFLVIFHSFLYVYQRVANNKTLFFAPFFP
jgi:hypothetical protein